MRTNRNRLWLWQLMMIQPGIFCTCGVMVAYYITSRQTSINNDLGFQGELVLNAITWVIISSINCAINLGSLFVYRKELQQWPTSSLVRKIILADILTFGAMFISSYFWDVYAVLITPLFTAWAVILAFEAANLSSNMRKKYRTVIAP